MKKLAALIMIATLALPATALAHAHLKRAAPRVGSTVKDAPKAVELWFSEALEGTFSTIQVLNAAGTRVDQQKQHLDAKDNAKLEVELPPLAPGTYTVRWHALSVDTHQTDGSFTFTIAP